MVFFYKIRGGPCKGELSHITLRQEDVICYVGRDKHENEELIAHGWPGDIWFHVDSVSSAHVYFRLNYDIAAAYHGNDKIPLTGAIPMDCLPSESVEDMMQIVKHNSIEGSKMASAKIVWTPHSNLKKNFDMEVGQVTYHDTKLCRYGRCHKDRARVKALEKTKSIDHTDIDLYAEKKKNERALIERRKQHKKLLARNGDKGSIAVTDGLFDPIESDRKLTLHKQTRQGDEQSGIDKGVAALESLALVDSLHVVALNTNGASGKMTSSFPNPFQDDSEDTPLWKLEYNMNDQEYGDNEMALFLLERGYPKSSVDEVIRQAKPTSNVGALHRLWSALTTDRDLNTESPQTGIDQDELLSCRQEEKEVLEAIFGEDIEWTATANGGDENSVSYILDLTVPITTYQPPDRYHLDAVPPPELRLEIYASPTIYPFGGEAPVLALVGGGIPQEYLHKMTLRLNNEALTKAAEEEPGTPYLFTLITFVGEIWESTVEQEGAAVAKANEEARKARIEALRKQQLENESLQSGEESSTPAGDAKSKFATEQERRAYAASVVAQCKSGRPGNDENKNFKASTERGRQYYDSGVSDAALIDDLFS